MKIEDLVKQQKESNARSHLLNRLFDIQRTRTYEYCLEFKKQDPSGTPDYELLARQPIYQIFSMVVALKSFDKMDNKLRYRFDRMIKAKEEFENQRGNYKDKALSVERYKRRMYENLNPASMANRLQTLVKNKPASTKKLIKRLRSLAHKQSKVVKESFEQHVSLESLYNKQAARCYEFKKYWDKIKNIDSVSFRNNTSKGFRKNNFSKTLDALSSNETKIVNFLWNRIIDAKKAYEAAGGKYEQ